MSFKKLFLATSATALLAGSALADGGPEADTPPPPPPPPAETEPYTPPPPAPAPAPSIWYAALHGGAVWANDIDFVSFGDLFQTDLETGWAVGGALGYRYESGFRAEFEGTYRTNDGDFLEIDPLLGALFAGPSEVSALNFMLNGIYDFDLGGAFTPYIGAGAGAAQVTVDAFGAFEDDGWGFAYQFIGGFAVPVPNTAIAFFADYRYLATAGLELEFGGIVDDHDDYESHSVLGGFQINF